MRKAGPGLKTAQGTDDKHWEAKKMTGDRSSMNFWGLEQGPLLESVWCDEGEEGQNISQRHEGRGER